MGKILVVEDDKNNLNAIKYILEADGYEVTAIEGTYDIIKDVKESNPDLIVTDYLLKGQNGSLICEELAANTATKHIPVILITAHRDIAMVIDRSCFSGFVIKPFDITTLLDVVTKGLTEPRIRMQ